MPFIWPPARTALVDYLQQHIGVEPGGAFRGRVANIAGVGWSADYLYYPFINQHNYDGMVAFFVGNDHDEYGFWYFNIPTLVETNQFSSPFFHLLTSRLLATSAKLHSRPQTTLTDFNPRALAGLGVRYVITSEPQEGETPVFVEKITEGRWQYLYKIAAPNIEGYAPTRIIEADTAVDAIRIIEGSDFDFAKDVVVHQDLSHVAAQLGTTAPQSLRF